MRTEAIRCVALTLLVTSAGCGQREEPKPDYDAVPRYLARQAELAASRAAAEEAAREAALPPEERKRKEAEKAAAEARDRAREAAIDKASKGLDSLQWWVACARWGEQVRRNSTSPQAVALERFLASKGLTNDLDVSPVYSRERLPRVGMSGCGATALLGVADDTNASTTASFTRVQMVYRNPRMYVYTEGRPGDHNGTVTSIQY